jgi:RibD C-terminal domain
VPGDHGQRPANPLAATHRLIDEYLLMIHPLVLGSGQRLFDHDDYVANLRLLNTTTTTTPTTGVILATYQPISRLAVPAVSNPQPAPRLESGHQAAAVRMPPARRCWAQQTASALVL